MSDNKEKELDHLAIFATEADATEAEDVDVVEQEYISAAPRHGYERIDKTLLAFGGKQYPENMEFDVRPANTAEIRHWSSIDDTTNPRKIYDYFNDIVEKCVKVINGSWSDIKETDRLWFVLKIHELSFIEAEKPAILKSACECKHTWHNKLSASSLQYVEPDAKMHKYVDINSGAFVVKTKSFGDITIQQPSLQTAMTSLAYMKDKDADWLTDNKLFLELSMYLIKPHHRASVKTFRDLYVEWSSWSSRQLSLMLDVINACKITPNPRLMVRCPKCGNETSQDFDLEGGIKSLLLPISDIDSELL